MPSRTEKTRPYARTEQVQTTLMEEERKALDEFASDRRSSRADAQRVLILDGLCEMGYLPRRKARR